MRSQLVPVVSVTSRFSQWLVIGGLVLGAASSSSGIGFYIAIAGLIMMALATAFSFITLPVEYDASNRALAWLKNKNMVTREELAGSTDALKWAARTYLVAALGSLAMLLYWALQILGGRD
jgi:Zn-dependent membrane protease YugP